MNTPTPISAAIATLNRPGGLARCLDAILGGEVLPAEVIVVDQSADLASQAVVEQRHSRLPLVYVRQVRQGLSASRNAAFAHALSPIVAMTDDDCVPDAAWIAALARAFAANPDVDGVTGRVLPLGPPRPGHYIVSPRESDTPAVFRGKVVPWRVGTGGNFALRHTAYRRIGGFDERLGAGSPGKAAEDADVMYRLLRDGGQVCYDPSAIVYHEWQSKAQRIRSRGTYGYGIGAACAIWMRDGDGFAAQLLRQRMLGRFRSLVVGIWRREWFEAYQSWLSLRGMALGMVYGARVARSTPRRARG